jgi:uncharacterized membrane protein (UPF0127 family)
MRTASAVLFAIALSACDDRGSAKPAVPAVVPVEVTTAAGDVHHFSLEVARTEAEQEKGLASRSALAKDGGMLFPIEPARPATFWMKNMMLPVDMIFVRSDRSIARIAGGMKPDNLKPEGSGEPVVAVIELPGGTTKSLGIAPGDHVTWKSAVPH